MTFSKRPKTPQGTESSFDSVHEATDSAQQKWLHGDMGLNEHKAKLLLKHIAPSKLVSEPINIVLKLLIKLTDSYSR